MSTGSKEKSLVYPPQEHLPGDWLKPWSVELQDLARRNSSAVLKARSQQRFCPFREDRRARKDFIPWSSTKELDPSPRVLLVARNTQEDRYFMARPYYPHWSLSSELFDRAMHQQAAAYNGNRLGRISYGIVYRLDGSAKEAEICGILFTRFFKGFQEGLEGNPGIPSNRSDWEIVTRYLDPNSEFRDQEKPEVFTFRSIFEPVYDARWPQITRDRDISNPITGGLPTAEKGRLVEDLMGNTLESLLGEVDNRHVRQVASRLLLLHPYDQTHQNLYFDKVIYQMNHDPYYFLAEQFLLAGELAGKLIPDPEAPVYIPNYGRIDSSVLGNMLVPDSWITNTLRKNPINALGELINAASFARDDSNGRLRGFATMPYIPGYTPNKQPMVHSFNQAVERALIHTALLLQEVYARDGKGHGIYPHLERISKKARDKYDRFGDSLARHPLLYDDPEDRRIRRDNPPPEDRGPEDDFSKIPVRPPSLRGSSY